jgi:nucleoside-diphosphate-sugar epimerase
VKSALVTGATGFLGSHIAEALAGSGWHVRALDVNPPERPFAGDIEFLQGDVREREGLLRAADGCELVVDNAALVPVTRSTPEQFLAVNLDGCRNALDAAAAAGAYVVHVSSSAIYGKPTRMPVTEETPLEPFESYGASKAEAEKLVHERRAGGQAIASLRSRALLGRGRLGLFELIFSRIRQGKRVPMFGNGDNVLQMCDARDFADSVLACVERRADGDYNIGAAEFGTPREDLSALIERVGSRSRLQPVPVWAIRSVLRPLDLIGRSPFTAWHWHASAATFYADITRAERELGWRPRYSNVDALERAYHEYLSGTAGRSAHSAPLKGALARLLRG